MSDMPQKIGTSVIELAQYKAIFKTIIKKYIFKLVNYWLMVTLLIWKIEVDSMNYEGKIYLFEFE